MQRDVGQQQVPYGMLDLLVLKTLAGMGELHGYGIARRIEQLVQESFALNQGTIYPALLRLEQRGWIASKWGKSENNRKARYYMLTEQGAKHLASEAAAWKQTIAMLSILLEGEV